jgi:TonB family protein
MDEVNAEHETAAARFCVHCGRHATPSGTFCQWCGKAATESVPQAELVVHEAPPGRQGDAVDSQLRQLGKLLVAVSPVLLLLAVVLYVWLPQPQNQPVQSVGEETVPQQQSEAFTPEASGSPPPEQTAMAPGHFWKVDSAVDPLSDMRMMTADTMAKDSHGIPHRLQLIIPNVDAERLSIEDFVSGKSPVVLVLTVEGTVPLGTNYRGNKLLQYRIDQEPAGEAVWRVGDEYPNVGRVLIRPNELLRATQRLLLQGLRDSDGLIEFPIDESFEPVRRVMRAMDGREQAARAERQRQADIAATALEDARRAQEARQRVEEEAAAQRKAEKDAIHAADAAASALTEARRRAELNELLAQGPVSVPTEGVTAPTILAQVSAVYPAAAKRKRVRGAVLLSVVVLANGDVGDVQVLKSLDREYGVDDAAVTAVRRWRFRPGTWRGDAIPTRVTIEVTFR